MANIRTRETASGPRYDVKFTFNGKHRMKTFRTFEDARAYKKKVEGEQLAGLVVDPKGGERLFARCGSALSARHRRAQQGDRRLPRRRDQVCPECAGVRPRPHRFVRS